MHLLDANIVSELRRPRPHGAVVAWLEAQADQLAGVWNVLPMDAVVFRQWARLMHRESDTVSEDAMIAATAQVHKLTVVTRNVRDFSCFDLAVFNPFEAG